MRSLPNLLSGFRLLAAPVLLALAFAGRREAFLWVLGASLASDALDGLAARALGARSELGRRLDSWGDYVTMLAVVPGVVLLWPEVVRREWPWIALGAGCYFAPVAVGLLRWKRAPAYHTRASKALAVAMAPATFLLLLGGTPWPFRIGMALQIAVLAEELAIMRLLPGYSGAISSLREARRRAATIRASSSPA